LKGEEKRRVRASRGDPVSGRQRIIAFERITYGTVPEGMGLRGKDPNWLATRIDNLIIPDYDLEFCNRLELEMRYSWKIIALASFIKSRAKKTGSYVLDIKTKEIKPSPFEK